MPPLRDLLLVGGGHSHIQVLKRFGMNPVPGIRLTIVSREIESPYSGMLPGHIAGLYGHSAMHIDLARLATFAGARFIHDEVVSLALDDNQIQLAAHPPLRFDLLSLNTGGVPVGVSKHVIPVKPIGLFLPEWEQVRASVKAGAKIVLVGGGAGGSELAMAMRSALPESVSLTVVCSELLPGFAEPARALVRHALATRRITLIEGFRAECVTPVALSAADGRVLPADHVFWVTGVSAAPLMRRSGLEVDELGFVVVDKHLRSVSHPRVFAAGDIACLLGQERPKSGVYAVREGAVLAANLIRTLLGKRLLSYRAQTLALVLMSTGNRRAIGSRGNFATEGRWLWWWKTFIDKRFMRRFNHLPLIQPAAFKLPKALQAGAPDPMRCGGCGAKLGASPLLRVLARLPAQNFSQVAMGIGDDAALIRSTGDVILTVDGFRSLISDPYLFGRITAHHSLNDVLAMAGRPVSALALATVPLMAESMMEDDLLQLLRGAVDVLNAHKVPLVGGHSAEGAELSLALTITGELDGRSVLSKGGLLPGQVLVLNKALGSGVLLAANMRGRLNAANLLTLLQSLDTSNAAALEILLECGATALTDVSGFGLAGHLAEMLRASATGADLMLANLPALPQALELLGEGVSSSLQQNNLQALVDFSGGEQRGPRYQLLADPQTAGGLLAGIPRERVNECLARLREAGYPAAAEIGEVTRNAPRLIGSAGA